LVIVEGGAPMLYVDLEPFRVPSSVRLVAL